MSTPAVVRTNLSTVPNATTQEAEQLRRTQSSSEFDGAWSAPADDGGDTVIETARRHGIIVDRDTADRLMKSCLANDPSITGGEVATLLDAKIVQLRKTRSVENWPALLAIAVPRMVPSFELARLREEKGTDSAHSRNVAQAVLADVDASPEEREWALAVLGKDPA